MDADSSQHSALIHALRGQNLVIEGPPGTGKSQTITNLIAAALVKGKTVLFVAEKLAALEVVRRRLDTCGLGFFCLELHSHKTPKDSLLSDLEQRIRAYKSFRDPRELDQQFAVVEEKKQLLSRYANLVNQQIDPLKATVFQIVWARDKAYQALTCDRELVSKVLLPVVLKYSPTDLAKTEQFLAVYARHLEAVLGVHEEIARHPWAWLRRPLAFAEAERILDLLTQFCRSVSKAVEYCGILETTASISLEGTLAGLGQVGHLLAALPVAQGSLHIHLLVPCRDPRVRTVFWAFLAEIEAANKAREAIGEATRDEGRSLLATTDDGPLNHALATLKALGFQDHAIEEIHGVLERSRIAQREITDSQRLFQGLVNLLGCDAFYSLDRLRLVLDTMQLIEDAPFDVLHLRRPSFQADGVGQIVREASEQSALLQQQQIDLGRDFDISHATTAYAADQLIKHAKVLEEAGFWQRLFGAEFRNAKRVHHTLALKPSALRRDQMAKDLRRIALHMESHQKFESSPLYRQALGDHFAGLATKWQDLGVLVQWYGDVFVKLSDHHSAAEMFRGVLFDSRLDRLKSLKSASASMVDQRGTLQAVRETLSTTLEGLPLAEPWSPSVAIHEVLPRLDDLNGKLSSSLEVLEVTGFHRHLALQDIPNYLLSVRAFRRYTDSVQSQTSIHSLLGHCYEGIETNVASITETLKFAEAIRACGIPSHTVEWILDENCISRLSDLRSWLQEVNRLAAELARLTSDLSEVSAAPEWAGALQEPLGTAFKRATDAIEHREDLTQWSFFIRVQAQSKDESLDRLTTLADGKAIEPHDLVQTFRYCFYNSLARGVFSERPELSELSGLTQEEIRKQFAKADKQTICLFRERAASIIDTRPVPAGNKSGPIGSWSELSLIGHEMGKQKRHIPIRQLVRRAARALQALKPCFMMGPLSVAQYLAPGQLKFDLLVMDEASQLKPEDAIGAIARSGQIVIVGDSMQLPPTNFFQRVLLDDENENSDDRAAVEEGESILDVARTLYQPVRRLRWHYRSQHHSLIAYSNREFYQNDLIVFPSSHHDVPNLGVKYRQVAGGVCENSRNPREASVVVEAVMDHMKDFPNETLGVVAMNRDQRELIEELVDQKLRSDPFAVSYQERMNSGPERFFIKNLENVQGDERDVIFISATYGPDSRGNQYQRFGPINGPNGHRRLNVLFTRAKKRTVVFSSLEPDKIQAGDGSSRGVRVLKEYLTFARTGIVEGAVETGDQPTNDFERSVGAVLNEKGYEVVYQVGVAGFFIDLAIRHPLRRGTFLLGIECDGAGYHSGRSARDRDRLRQEILENLGWKIHRVWSTDWFKSRDIEIKRLLGKIQDLLANDPEYAREKEKTQKVDSLRQQLVDLRELQIKPAYPQSPPERGLLRKTLLDEFVKKRPKTKEEWFRLISHDLRSGTESEQVGRYLEQVLSMIDASE